MEWTEPGTVTKIKVEKTVNRLYTGEAALIAKKNKWQPIKTLSEYLIPESLSLDGVRKMALPGLYKSVYMARVRLMDILRGIRKVAKARLKLNS